jgi:hypothetical protein
MICMLKTVLIRYVKINYFAPYIEQVIDLSIKCLSNGRFP